MRTGGPQLERPDTSERLPWRLWRQAACQDKTVEKQNKQNKKQKGDPVSLPLQKICPQGQLRGSASAAGVLGGD